MNGAERDSERNGKAVTAVAVVSREFAFSLFLLDYARSEPQQTFNSSALDKEKKAYCLCPRLLRRISTIDHQGTIAPQFNLFIL
jgi:hypothetical protein